MTDRQRAMLTALIAVFERDHGKKPRCILAHRDAYCNMCSDYAHGCMQTGGRLIWKGIEVKAVDCPGNAIYLADEPEYIA